MIECNLTTQLDQRHWNAQYEIKQLYKLEKTKTNLNNSYLMGFHFLIFIKDNRATVYCIGKGKSITKVSSDCLIHSPGARMSVEMQQS